MAAQDQLEDTKPNDSVTAGICCNSGSEQSENVLQLKELFSSESDQMPKARKPYTITKQREKWTEEEHQKFLEALKLYGRGWCKIQEHIGSKTAVQIRSHAQKFFSKVARESNGSAESSVKPIEIPPPRPKRKPMHPYPRKSVDILKGTPVSNQLERIPSPNLVVSEKENQSPTSVLYAVASDTLGSAISGQHNGCSSPASWTSDVQSMTLPLDEKENEHVISNLSAEEDKGYLSSAQLSFSPNLENFSSNDEACANGDANSVPIRSIKLFGRTVLVSDSEKSYPRGAEDCLLETSKTNLRNSKFKKEKLVGSLPGKLDTEIPLGMVNTKTNLFSTVGPYCYQFTELHQKNVNCSETINPLTWPTFCQGMPFLHLTPDDSTSSLRRPIDSFVEERPKQKVLNEVSCTGSNDGSVSEVENRERNLEVVDSSRKGFVSYKRCLAKREVNSLVCTGEEREQQRARVCS